ncbi:TetR/AcrR family transcriptional regulator [Nocardioides sp. cx-169]|uniref:TetR/AcrR family transcriptional regulator n=1 Tax=Nocardioides sp. cx-169 TaxID=2899080 RepID=UPI001E5EF1BD|nr:TetR/AcrR family transcriptional regulator [Nocardioides sp. cx-169]MCD4535293.1 TetR/AcrR family transcriptional regulator [Nocardioides sp. cx-169]
MAGRPRSFDRDAALAVAVEQFWRAGYDETSVATLTAAMGVTPPSLYAAFGDKHRLFEEASAAYFQRTCEAVDRAATLATARDAIAQILDDAARAHTESATPPGCLMLTEPRLGAQREALRKRLEDRLEQGVRDGDLPATTDTGRLAVFLVAVLRGMSGCARDGGSAEDVLAIAEVALAALPPRPGSTHGTAPSHHSQEEDRP